MRTIVDLVLTQHGDYRDLFTTRKTFLTPLLGSVYRVPVAQSTGTWERYEFAAGDPRAGIQSEASFVALHSHEGLSSPTLRGKALRELLLCEPIPAPPGNVNFAVAQDTHNPNFKTMRDRLTAHRTDPTCAGCHKLMDPIGLALESFDSDAGYRTSENGVLIDTSGELDGVEFSDLPPGSAARYTTIPRLGARLARRLLLLRDRPRARAAGYGVDKVPGEAFRRRRLPGPRIDAADRSEREFLPARPARAGARPGPTAPPRRWPRWAR